MNASKTKTMIVSRSDAMPHQWPQLTLGCPVFGESVDSDILGMTFDSKMNFEDHICSVSRAAF